MGKKFWVNCILATFFIFSLLWIIKNVSQLGVFDAFDAFGDALADAELTDVVFSELRADPPADTNIVVINVGPLSREGIGRQLEIVNRYGPKVVGFDIFFTQPSTDSLGDAVLSRALMNTKRLVMASKLLQTPALAEKRAGEYAYDSLERSLPVFRKNAHEAFANLDTDALDQNDYKTCRKFMPQCPVSGENHQAFAVKIAALYQPEKVRKFLDRDKQLEVINYRGNLVDVHERTGYPNMFYVLDTEDLFSGNFTPDLLRGKIVLFGFMGNDLLDTSWDDRFFTPMNVNYAGKANPDMYGVVVHANIISMILNEDYIDSFGYRGQVLMALVLCFLNVFLFSVIYVRLPKWYDGLTKLLQLVEILLLSLLMVFVFYRFNFKLNLAITIAAIALAGDSLEFYYGVLVNLFEEGRKKVLKKKKTV